MSRVQYTGVEATLASMGLAPTSSSLHTYSITGISDIESQSASRLALDAVNVAITSLTRNRGTLGAAESRLGTAINNLSIARENFTAAESRIMDVDVAEESSNLTRLSILQQAGTAILAQANQQPQLALQLLRG